MSSGLHVRLLELSKEAAINGPAECLSEVQDRRWCCITISCEARDAKVVFPAFLGRLLEFPLEFVSFFDAGNGHVSPFLFLHLLACLLQLRFLLTGLSRRLSHLFDAKQSMHTWWLLRASILYFGRQRISGVGTIPRSASRRALSAVMLLSTVYPGSACHWLSASLSPAFFWRSAASLHVPRFACRPPPVTAPFLVCRCVHGGCLVPYTVWGPTSLRLRNSPAARVESCLVCIHIAIDCLH